MLFRPRLEYSYFYAGLRLTIFTLYIIFYNLQHAKTNSEKKKSASGTFLTYISKKKIGWIWCNRLSRRCPI